jgi:osmotically-inducible protein OsmY
LVIETDADTVVVRGTVETYYQKQMAQEIMRRVEGVQKIDNQLEVSWG